MRKKLSPLVEAIELWTNLDERDKSLLAEWIRIHSPKKPRRVTRPPKSDLPNHAGSAGKKSLSRKELRAEPEANTLTGMEDVGIAAGA